jgi:hypothetical protein
MSDKLVFEVDSVEAERHLRSLTQAAEQLGKTFKETKGATSALKELRQLLVGLKGQRSAFDELKSAINGLNASAATMATGFERAIGQLGVSLTNELRSIRDAVRMGGLAVGQAATDGMSDGIKAGTKDVKKSIDDMGKQAVATSKSVAVAMNNALGSYTRYSPATGLKGSVVSNLGVASIMMNMPSKADFIAATAKAVEEAKAAQQSAMAQVKAATIQASGSYSSIASGRTYLIKNAETFMNMPSKAEWQIATANIVAEAKAAQASAQAQVKAATMNAAGDYSSIKTGRTYMVKNAETFMNMPSKAEYVLATTKAVQELAEAQAAIRAQVKALMVSPSGDYSTLSTGKLNQVRNAELFMNMPSKAAYEMATAKAVADAKAAQEAAIAQVRAATNASTQLYQRYNASTMTAGSMVNMPAAAPKLAVPKASELDGLSKGLQKFTIDANDAHSAARGLASGFGLLFLTWGKLIPLFAGAGISYGIKKTFDIGSEVEYQIKMMEVLGQTVDETGKQFEGAGSVIRAELRAIDQETQFSLLDLSKAMVDIQQQGRSTAEAIGMLRPAAALASLGQTDLKTATNLLNSSLNAFSLNVAESGKVAAQLFQATKSAPLTIEDLSASIKYASEINVGYGQSLEEVLTLLGSLSKVNLRGTSGGTSVINFMRDIAGRSGPAIKALETLRKTTGDTLKVMEGGKFRPMIAVMQEIGESLKKIEPGEGMRLLQKMTSDRGIRAYFAAIREGTDDINKLRSEIEKTSEVELFKAQRGLMDTTKGAFDVLKGAIVGALDAVFEGFADKFKGAIIDVTALISSGGFKQTVAGMVGAVMSLYEAIKTLGPALVTIFGLMAGWKVLTVGIALFQGLAGAMAGVATASMSTAAGLGISTAALATNGGASLAGAAASKAAAMGLNETAVAAVRAGTATAAAAGPMRALAVAIGFLNNPIVGVISALTLMAATYFISSNAASKAMGDTSKSVVDNGKINEEQWRKEIGLLRTRQHLLGGDQYSGMEAELQKAQAGLKTAEDRLATHKAGSAPNPKLIQRWEADIQAQKDTIRNGYRDIAELREQEVDRQLKSEADALKKANDQMARLQGTLTTPKGGAGAGAAGRPAFETVDLDRNKELQTIQAFYDQQLSVQTDAYNREKKLMDARRTGELLSESQYMTQSYNLAQQYEDNQIALLEQGSAEYLAKFVERYAKMSAAMEAAKTKEAKNIYGDAIEKEQNEAAAQAAKTSAAILKVRAEAAERVELTYINLESTAGKLIKTDNEFWNSRARSRDAEKAAKELERAYGSINTSILSNDGALYAQAQAQAKVKAEVEEHNAKLREQLSIHQQILEAERLQLQSDGENPLIGAEELARKQALITKMETAVSRMGKTLEESTAKGLEDGTEEGLKAFEEYRKKQFDALTSEIGDAIMLGITGSGADAGKALRDILQRELMTKPLTAFIKGTIDSITGGSGTGSSAEGGGGLKGILGMLNTAKNVYQTGSKVAGWMGLGSTTASGLGLTASAGAGTALTGVGSGLGLTGGLGTGYGLAAGGGLGLTAGSAGASTIGAGIGTSAAATGGTAAAGASSAMSGLMAAGPYIAAAMAVYMLIKKLDDSGTPHMGAGAIYNSTTGLQGGKEIYGQGSFGMGHPDEYNAELQTGISGIATGIGMALDTFAVSFGKTAGYTIATAFGDDSSKDGAWGSLKIADELGKVLVNWEDTRTSKWAPKTFANGEQGYTEYLAAVAMDVRKAMLAMDLPGWADQILTAATDVETLNAALAEISTIQNGLKNLGQTMTMFANLSATAQTRLLDAAGGIEALVSSAEAFYEGFYTEGERALRQRELQMSALQKMGLYIDPAEGSSAKTMFRKTVEEAMASGQMELAAKLLAMSGAFAQTADYAQGLIDNLAKTAKLAAEKAADSLKNLAQTAANLMASAADARTKAGDLYDRISEAMGDSSGAYAAIREQKLWAAMVEADYEQQIELAGELTDLVLSRYQLEKSNAESLLDFGKSLKAYVDNLKLGQLSPLTTGEKLAEAAKQYKATLEAAQGGDATAMSKLQGASSSYLELARQYYASSNDYTRIFDNVTGALTDLGVASETEAQQQLNVSSKSLQELRKLQAVASEAYQKANTEFEIQKSILQEQVNQLMRTAGGIEAVRDILSGMPAELAGQISSGGALGTGRYSALAQSYVDILGGKGGSSTDTGYVASAMANLDAQSWSVELKNALALLTDTSAKQQMQSIFNALAQMKGINGSHANGLGFVPFDNYIAELHRGERVLTAQENRSYTMPSWNNPGQAQTGSDDLVAELIDVVEVLIDEVVTLRTENREDAGRLAQATFQAAEVNAKDVVDGVAKGTAKAAWGQNLKKKAGEYN